jgi:acetylornithine/succinyldiaminopimelate/putrescine aminotransferase
LTVLRFLPPLVISQSDLARAADLVEEVLNQQVREDVSA